MTQKEPPIIKVEVDSEEFRRKLLRIFVKIVQTGRIDAVAYFLKDNPVFLLDDLYKSEEFNLFRIFSGRTSVFLIPYLIERKLNLSLKDREGNCLLELAINYRDRGLLEELLSAGANPNLRNGENKTMLMVALEHAMSEMDLWATEKLLAHKASWKEDFPEVEKGRNSFKNLSIVLYQAFQVKSKEGEEL